MNLDKETENQVQELQILEQSLQAILMQKQAFYLELSEIENASKELGKSDGEVYKIVGQVMLKSKKSDVEKDLKQKRELVSIRMKSIESQEKSLSEKVEELRQKVLSKIQK